MSTDGFNPDDSLSSTISSTISDKYPYLAAYIMKSYALTLYGDMDISSIRTMSSGRKPVKTYEAGSGS